MKDQLIKDITDLQGSLAENAIESRNTAELLLKA